MDSQRRVDKRSGGSHAALPQGHNLDNSLEARERLRIAYLSFRERVALLAAEIHTYLPDYTVHDITHLDALWEMSDIIAGNEYALTPTEAFIYGGSILLHDLGMALSSYTGGIEELKKNESWPDLVAACYISQLNRQPNSEEIINPPKDIEKVVISRLLRNLHAKHAEQLALIHWRAKENDPPQFLIEDNEIRLAFGRVIGLIAHSHWWTISQVEKEFTRTIGAPYWCPIDWVIDPLKLACLLRVADASHIDARRSPSFLRALRRPVPFSDEHWKFQEKLQKPHLTGDALTYTSGYAFPLADASSWWTCLDTLSMIDRELRQTDALLADKGTQRFAARRIAGIESPERLVSFIPTDNWLPLDSKVHVSDVPRLVRILGAEDLYGPNPTVALRELIQNASDAIRARRSLENRPEDFGEINVRLGKDERGQWIEIEDNGIGMSSEVLTDYLLDFGSSYWGSDLMINEWPGLLSSNIHFIGKYGIGFFSVFMLGNAVRVSTRRVDAARNETMILEFNTGLSTRPIIRRAASNEVIKDGGTCVRVWLEKNLDIESRLPIQVNFEKPNTLKSLFGLIAPGIDVDLKIESSCNRILGVSSSDWVDMNGRELLLRLSPLNTNWRNPLVTLDKQFISRAAKNLRLITNPDGEIVGRACVVIPHLGLGVLTVGGLFASELIGVGGILTGVSERASRDAASPIVTKDMLVAWATEQSDLVPQLFEDVECLKKCAQIIRHFGGETKQLPIATWKGKLTNYVNLSKADDIPDELFLVSWYDWDKYEKLPGFSPRPDVIFTDHGAFQGIIKNSFRWSEWPFDMFNSWGYGDHSMEANLGGAVVEALAEAWKTTVKEILIASNYTTDYGADYHNKKIVIGSINNADVKSEGLLIRKPKLN